ncbi:hypothetical protein [Methanopyrus sp.]
MNELLATVLAVLSPVTVAGFVEGHPMPLTALPNVQAGVVSSQGDVTRVVLTTPELDEGVVFVRQDDRWRETVGGTGTRLLRRLDDVRARWSGGYLHVQCPKSAEVLLLVPGPGGIPVTEDSTFLEGGPLPEGAHALLGERVRIYRYMGPIALGVPFETARESLVSVRWLEDGIYYEYTDWVAHDWDRSPRSSLLSVLAPCVRRRGEASA